MSHEKVKAKIDVTTREAGERFRTALFAAGGAETDRIPAGQGVLVHELRGDPDADLDGLRALRERHPSIEIFLTAPQASQALLLKAMRAGITEFFPQPVDEAEVLEALARFGKRLERPDGGDSPSRSMVIDVIGTKGGVGATTIAVNIAAALAARSDPPRVLLLDLNLPGGEVPLFLDMRPQHNWGEALRDISRVDAAFLSGLAARRGGLHVLPAPSSLEDMQAAAAAPPEAMARLLAIVREMYDVVLVDGGQYLDETALGVMERADVLLAVTVQSLPCLASLKRLLQNVRQFAGEQSGLMVDDKLRLVVSRHLKESDLTVEDMEETLARKVFWRVPDDYRGTLAAINQGKTLLECAPKSPAAKSILDLAGALSPETASRQASGGLAAVLSRLGLGGHLKTA